MLRENFVCNRKCVLQRGALFRTIWLINRCGQGRRCKGWLICGVSLLKENGILIFFYYQIKNLNKNNIKLSNNTFNFVMNYFSYVLLNTNDIRENINTIRTKKLIFVWNKYQNRINVKRCDNNLHSNVWNITDIFQ